jgi:creatinine amidohydrolase/Fe(II)-dependent formamide hydrolase-like protein
LGLARAEAKRLKQAVEQGNEAQHKHDIVTRTLKDDVKKLRADRVESVTAHKQEVRILKAALGEVRRELTRSHCTKRKCMCNCESVNGPGCVQMSKFEDEIAALQKEQECMMMKHSAELQKKRKHDMVEESVDVKAPPSKRVQPAEVVPSGSGSAVVAPDSAQLKMQDGARSINPCSD